jgi:hypothetical protein
VYRAYCVVAVIEVNWISSGANCGTIPGMLVDPCNNVYPSLAKIPNVNAPVGILLRRLGLITPKIVMSSIPVNPNCW